MTHKEILASFREKFVADGIGDCIPTKNWEEMEGEVGAFLLEALTQERLRTLADCERAVEKEKIDESSWPAPDDGFGYGNKAIDRATTAIRNLKPKV